MEGPLYLRVQFLYYEIHDLIKDQKYVRTSLFSSLHFICTLSFIAVNVSYLQYNKECIINE